MRELTSGSGRFTLDDLVIDTGTHEVSRAGVPVPLSGLTYRLLLALVEAAPNVVPHEVLVARVWGGVVVSPEALAQRVRLLRRALGESAIEPRYVGVVRGEGYRLLETPVALPDPAPPPVNSSAVLAVIPFTQLSDIAAHAYFADGLTEELSQHLDKIPGLRVISPRSVYTVARDDASVQAMAEWLHVNHVLEGSVRWSERAVAVTARLVTAPEGEQLWSQTYTAKHADVLEIQQRIARAVARTLKVSFDFGGRRFELGGTRDLDAYLHYLRGKRLFYRHTAESNEEARLAMERACERDPEFALAWAQLAYIQGGRARQSRETEAALAEMAVAAERALDLAPEHFRCHVAHAWALMSRRRWVASHAATERARHLARQEGGPSDLDFRDLLWQYGYLREAHAEAQALYAKDPLLAGDFPFALFALGELDPADWRAEGTDGAMEDERKFALMLMRRDAAEIDAWFGPRFAGRFGTPSFVDALKDLLARRPRTRRGALARIAMLAARGGAIDLALEFLRVEYLRDGFGAYFLIWHPALREVRQRPGFKTFLVELGLVELWRQTGVWGDLVSPVGDDDFVCQ